MEYINPKIVWVPRMQREMKKEKESKASIDYESKGTPQTMCCRYQVTLFSFQWKQITLVGSNTSQAYTRSDFDEIDFRSVEASPSSLVL